MSNKQAPAEKITTPEGILVWPRLNAPDTKFDADGVYTGKIRLSAEDSAVVIEQYETALEKHFQETKEALQQKVKEAVGPKKGPAKKELDELKTADKPYKPAYDDEGNETGEYEFNFKSPAQFTRKKDGKVIKIRPDIFDARGKQLKVIPEIWGGTRAVVAGELRPFYTAKAGCGLSLRLLAVQIIELASGGGSRDAGAYGFGAKEGGYEGSDEEPSGNSEAGSDSEDDGDSAGPQDF